MKTYLLCILFSGTVFTFIGKSNEQSIFAQHLDVNTCSMQCVETAGSVSTSKNWAIKLDENVHLLYSAENNYISTYNIKLGIAVVYDSVSSILIIVNVESGDSLLIRSKTAFFVKGSGAVSNFNKETEVYNGIDRCYQIIVRYKEQLIENTTTTITTDQFFNATILLEYLLDLSGEIDLTTVVNERTDLAIQLKAAFGTYFHSVSTSLKKGDVSIAAGGFVLVGVVFDLSENHSIYQFFYALYVKQTVITNQIIETFYSSVTTNNVSKINAIAILLNNVGVLYKSTESALKAYRAGHFHSSREIVTIGGESTLIQFSNDTITKTWNIYFRNSKTSFSIGYSSTTNSLMLINFTYKLVYVIPSKGEFWLVYNGETGVAIAVDKHLGRAKVVDTNAVAIAAAYKAKNFKLSVELMTTVAVSIVSIDEYEYTFKFVDFLQSIQENGAEYTLKLNAATKAKIDANFNALVVTYKGIEGVTHREGSVNALRTAFKGFNLGILTQQCIQLISDTCIKSNVFFTESVLTEVYTDIQLGVSVSFNSSSIFKVLGGSSNISSTERQESVPDSKSWAVSLDENCYLSYSAKNKYIAIFNDKLSIAVVYDSVSSIIIICNVNTGDSLLIRSQIATFVKGSGAITDFYKKTNVNNGIDWCYQIIVRYKAQLIENTTTTTGEYFSVSILLKYLLDLNSEIDLTTVVNERTELAIQLEEAFGSYFKSVSTSLKKRDGAISIAAGEFVLVGNVFDLSKNLSIYQFFQTLYTKKIFITTEIIDTFYSSVTTKDSSILSTIAVLLNNVGVLYKSSESALIAHKAGYFQHLQKTVTISGQKTLIQFSRDSNTKTWNISFRNSRTSFAFEYSSETNSFILINFTYKLVYVFPSKEKVWLIYNGQTGVAIAVDKLHGRATVVDTNAVAIAKAYKTGNMKLSVELMIAVAVDVSIDIEYSFKFVDFLQSIQEYGDEYTSKFNAATKAKIDANFNALIVSYKGIKGFTHHQGSVNALLTAFKGFNLGLLTHQCIQLIYTTCIKSNVLVNESVLTEVYFDIQLGASNNFSSSTIFKVLGGGDSNHSHKEIPGGELEGTSDENNSKETPESVPDSKSWAVSLDENCYLVYSAKNNYIAIFNDKLSIAVVYDSVSSIFIICNVQTGDSLLIRSQSAIFVKGSGAITDFDKKTNVNNGIDWCYQIIVHNKAQLIENTTTTTGEYFSVSILLEYLLDLHGEIDLTTVVNERTELAIQLEEAFGSYFQSVSTSLKKRDGAISIAAGEFVLVGKVFDLSKNLSLYQFFHTLYTKKIFITTEIIDTFYSSVTKKDSSILSAIAVLLNNVGVLYESSESALIAHKAGYFQHLQKTVTIRGQNTLIQFSRDSNTKTWNISFRNSRTSFAFEYSSETNSLILINFTYKLVYVFPSKEKVWLIYNGQTGVAIAVDKLHGRATVVDTNAVAIAKAYKTGNMKLSVELMIAVAVDVSIDIEYSFKFVDFLYSIQEFGAEYTSKFNAATKAKIDANFNALIVSYKGIKGFTHHQGSVNALLTVFKGFNLGLLTHQCIQLIFTTCIKSNVLVNESVLTEVYFDIQLGASNNFSSSTIFRVLGGGDSNHSHKERPGGELEGTSDENNSKERPESVPNTKSWAVSLDENCYLVYSAKNNYIAIFNDKLSIAVVYDSVSSIFIICNVQTGDSLLIRSQIATFVKGSGAITDFDKKTNVNNGIDWCYQIIVNNKAQLIENTTTTTGEYFSVSILLEYLLDLHGEIDLTTVVNERTELAIQLEEAFGNYFQSVSTSLKKRDGAISIAAGEFVLVGKVFDLSKNLSIYQFFHTLYTKKIFITTEIIDTFYSSVTKKDSSILSAIAVLLNNVGVLYESSESALIAYKAGYFQHLQKTVTSSGQSTVIQFSRDSNTKTWNIYFSNSRTSFAFEYSSETNSLILINFTYKLVYVFPSKEKVWLIYNGQTGVAIAVDKLLGIAKVVDTNADEIAVAYKAENLKLSVELMIAVAVDVSIDIEYSFKFVDFLQSIQRYGAEYTSEFNAATKAKIDANFNALIVSYKGIKGFTHYQGSVNALLTVFKGFNLGLLTHQCIQLIFTTCIKSNVLVNESVLTEVYFDIQLGASNNFSSSTIFRVLGGGDSNHSHKERPESELEGTGDENNSKERPESVPDSKSWAVSLDENCYLLYSAKNNYIAIFNEKLSIAVVYDSVSSIFIICNVQTGDSLVIRSQNAIFVKGSGAITDFDKKTNVNNGIDWCYQIIVHNKAQLIENTTTTTGEYFSVSILLEYLLDLHGEIDLTTVVNERTDLALQLEEAFGSYFQSVSTTLKKREGAISIAAGEFVLVGKVFDLSKNLSIYQFFHTLYTKKIFITTEIIDTFYSSVTKKDSSILSAIAILLNNVGVLYESSESALIAYKAGYFQHLQKTVTISGQSTVIQFSRDSNTKTWNIYFRNSRTSFAFEYSSETNSLILINFTYKLVYVFPSKGKLWLIYNGQTGVALAVDKLHGRATVVDTNAVAIAEAYKAGNMKLSVELMIAVAVDVSIDIEYSFKFVDFLYSIQEFGVEYTSKFNAATKAKIDANFNALIVSYKGIKGFTHHQGSVNVLLAVFKGFNLGLLTHQCIQLIFTTCIKSNVLVNESVLTEVYFDIQLGASNNFSSSTIFRVLGGGDSNHSHKERPGGELEGTSDENNSKETRESVPDSKSWAVSLDENCYLVYSAKNNYIAIFNDKLSIAVVYDSVSSIFIICNVQTGDSLLIRSQIATFVKGSGAITDFDKKTNVNNGIDWCYQIIVHNKAQLIENTTTTTGEYFSVTILLEYLLDMNSEIDLTTVVNERTDLAIQLEEAFGSYFQSVSTSLKKRDGAISIAAGEFVLVGNVFDLSKNLSIYQFFQTLFTKKIFITAEIIEIIYSSVTKKDSTIISAIAILLNNVGVLYESSESALIAYKAGHFQHLQKTVTISGQSTLILFSKDSNTKTWNIYFRNSRTSFTIGYYSKTKSLTIINFAYNLVFVFQSKGEFWLIYNGETGVAIAVDKHLGEAKVVDTNAVAIEEAYKAGNLKLSVELMIAVAVDVSIDRNEYSFKFVDFLYSIQEFGVEYTFKFNYATKAKIDANFNALIVNYKGIEGFTHLEGSANALLTVFKGFNLGHLTHQCILLVSTTCIKSNVLFNESVLAEVYVDIQMGASNSFSSSTIFRVLGGGDSNSSTTETPESEHEGRNGENNSKERPESVPDSKSWAVSLDENCYLVYRAKNNYIAIFNDKLSIAVVYDSVSSIFIICNVQTGDSLLIRSQIAIFVKGSGAITDFYKKTNVNNGIDWCYQIIVTYKAQLIENTTTTTGKYFSVTILLEYLLDMNTEIDLTTVVNERTDLAIQLEEAFGSYFQSVSTSLKKRDGAISIAAGEFVLVGNVFDLSKNLSIYQFFQTLFTKKIFITAEIIEIIYSSVTKKDSTIISAIAILLNNVGVLYESSESALIAYKAGHFQHLQKTVTISGQSTLILFSKDSNTKRWNIYFRNSRTSFTIGYYSKTKSLTFINFAYKLVYVFSSKGAFWLIYNGQTGVAIAVDKHLGEAKVVDTNAVAIAEAYKGGNLKLSVELMIAVAVDVSIDRNEYSFKFIDFLYSIQEFGVEYTFKFNYATKDKINANFNALIVNYKGIEGFTHLEGSVNALLTVFKGFNLGLLTHQCIQLIFTTCIKSNVLVNESVLTEVYFDIQLGASNSFSSSTIFRVLGGRDSNSSTTERPESELEGTNCENKSKERPESVPDSESWAVRLDENCYLLYSAKKNYIAIYNINLGIVVVYDSVSSILTICNVKTGDSLLIRSQIAFFVEGSGAVTGFNKETTIHTGIDWCYQIIVRYKAQLIENTSRTTGEYFSVSILLEYLLDLHGEIDLTTVVNERTELAIQLEEAFGSYFQSVSTSLKKGGGGISIAAGEFVLVGIVFDLSNNISIYQFFHTLYTKRIFITAEIINTFYSSVTTNKRSKITAIAVLLYNVGVLYESTESALIAYRAEYFHYMRKIVTISGQSTLIQLSRDSNTKRWNVYFRNSRTSFSIAYCSQTRSLTFINFAYKLVFVFSSKGEFWLIYNGETGVAITVSKLLGTATVVDTNAVAIAAAYKAGNLKLAIELMIAVAVDVSNDVLEYSFKFVDFLYSINKYGAEYTFKFNYATKAKIDANFNALIVNYKGIKRLTNLEGSANALLTVLKGFNLGFLTSQCIQLVSVCIKSSVFFSESVLSEIYFDIQFGVSISFSSSSIFKVLDDVDSDSGTTERPESELKGGNGENNSKERPESVPDSKSWVISLDGNCYLLYSAKNSYIAIYNVNLGIAVVYDSVSGIVVIVNVNTGDSLLIRSQIAFFVKGSRAVTKFDEETKVTKRIDRCYQIIVRYKAQLIENTTTTTGGSFSVTILLEYLLDLNGEIDLTTVVNERTDFAIQLEEAFGSYFQSVSTSLKKRDGAISIAAGEFVLVGNVFDLSKNLSIYQFFQTLYTKKIFITTEIIEIFYSSVTKKDSSIISAIAMLLNNVGVLYESSKSALIAYKAGHFQHLQKTVTNNGQSTLILLSRDSNTKKWNVYFRNSRTSFSIGYCSQTKSLTIINFAYNLVFVFTSKGDFWLIYNGQTGVAIAVDKHLGEAKVVNTNAVAIAVAYKAGNLKLSVDLMIAVAVDVSIDRYEYSFKFVEFLYSIQEYGVEYTFKLKGATKAKIDANFNALIVNYKGIKGFTHHEGSANALLTVFKGFNLGHLTHQCILLVSTTCIKSNVLFNESVLTEVYFDIQLGASNSFSSSTIFRVLGGGDSNSSTTERPESEPDNKSWAVSLDENCYLLYSAKNNYIAIYNVHLGIAVVYDSVSGIVIIVNVNTGDSLLIRSQIAFFVKGSRAVTEFDKETKVTKRIDSCYQIIVRYKAQLIENTTTTTGRYFSVTILLDYLLDLNGEIDLTTVVNERTDFAIQLEDAFGIYFQSVSTSLKKGESGISIAAGEFVLVGVVFDLSKHLSIYQFFYVLYVKQIVITVEIIDIVHSSVTTNKRSKITAIAILLYNVGVLYESTESALIAYRAEHFNYLRKIVTIRGQSTLILLSRDSNTKKWNVYFRNSRTSFSIGYCSQTKSLTIINFAYKLVFVFTSKGEFWLIYNGQTGVAIAVDKHLGEAKVVGTNAVAIAVAYNAGNFKLSVELMIAVAVDISIDRYEYSFKFVDFLYSIQEYGVEYTFKFNYATKAKIDANFNALIVNYKGIKGFTHLEGSVNALLTVFKGFNLGHLTHQCILLVSTTCIKSNILFNESVLADVYVDIQSAVSASFSRSSIFRVLGRGDSNHSRKEKPESVTDNKSWIIRLDANHYLSYSAKNSYIATYNVNLGIAAVYDSVSGIVIIVNVKTGDSLLIRYKIAFFVKSSGAVSEFDKETSVSKGIDWCYHTIVRYKSQLIENTSTTTGEYFSVTILLEYLLDLNGEIDLTTVVNERTDLAIQLEDTFGIYFQSVSTSLKKGVGAISVAAGEFVLVGIVFDLSKHLSIYQFFYVLYVKQIFITVEIIDIFHSSVTRNNSKNITAIAVLLYNVGVLYESTETALVAYRAKYFHYLREIVTISGQSTLTLLSRDSNTMKWNVYFRNSRTSFSIGYWSKTKSLTIINFAYNLVFVFQSKGEFWLIYNGQTGVAIAVDKHLGEAKVVDTNAVAIAMAYKAGNLKLSVELMIAVTVDVSIDRNEYSFKFVDFLYSIQEFGVEYTFKFNYATKAKIDANFNALIVNYKGIEGFTHLEGSANALLTVFKGFNLGHLTHQCILLVSATCIKSNILFNESVLADVYVDIQSAVSASFSRSSIFRVLHGVGSNSRPESEVEGTSGENNSKGSPESVPASKSWEIQLDGNCYLLYSAKNNYIAIYNVNLGITVVYDSVSGIVIIVNVKTGDSILMHFQIAFFVKGSGAVADFDKETSIQNGIDRCYQIIELYKAALIENTSTTTGEYFSTTILLEYLLDMNGEIDLTTVVNERAELAIQLRAAFGIYFHSLSTLLKKGDGDISIAGGAFVLTAAVFDLSKNLAIYQFFITLYAKQIFITVELIDMFYSSVQKNDSTKIIAIVRLLFEIGIFYESTESALIAYRAGYFGYLREMVTMNNKHIIILFSRDSKTKEWNIYFRNSRTAFGIGYFPRREILVFVNFTYKLVFLFPAKGASWLIYNGETGVAIAISKLLGRAKLVDTDAVAISAAFKKGNYKLSLELMMKVPIEESNCLNEFLFIDFLYSIRKYGAAYNFNFNAATKAIIDANFHELIVNYKGIEGFIYPEGSINGLLIIFKRFNLDSLTQQCIQLVSVVCIKSRDFFNEKIMAEFYYSIQYSVPFFFSSSTIFKILDAPGNNNKSNRSSSSSSISSSSSSWSKSSSSSGGSSSSSKSSSIKISYNFSVGHDIFL